MGEASSNQTVARLSREALTLNISSDDTVDLDATLEFGDITKDGITATTQPQQQQQPSPQLQQQQPPPQAQPQATSQVKLENASWHDDGNTDTSEFPYFLLLLHNNHLFMLC